MHQKNRKVTEFFLHNFYPASAGSIQLFQHFYSSFSSGKSGRRFANFSSHFLSLWVSVFAFNILPFGKYDAKSVTRYDVIVQTNPHLFFTIFFPR